MDRDQMQDKLLQMQYQQARNRVFGAWVAVLFMLFAAGLATFIVFVPH